MMTSALAPSRYRTALRPTLEQKRLTTEKGITNERLKELGIADNIEGITNAEANELILLANVGRNQGSARGRAEKSGKMRGVEMSAEGEAGAGGESEAGRGTVGDYSLERDGDL